MENSTSATTNEVVHLSASLRAERAAATHHTQGSYDAFFGDHAVTSVTRTERLAVALRVSVLHDEPVFVEHFAALLRDGADDMGAVVAGVSVFGKNRGVRFT